MGFIVHKEGFRCAFCGEENPPAQRTCRNHCRKCLMSLHVDDKTPGDRASMCNGKMIPAGVEMSRKKEWVIVHRCKKCGKTQKNISAADDDFEGIAEIAEKIGRGNRIEDGI